MTDLIAHVSRSMLVFSMAGGFAGSGFSLWAVGALGPTPADYALPNIFTEAAVWISAVLLGIVGVGSAARLSRPREVLRVGAQGVLWTRWSNRLIPWSEIARVAVRDIKFSRYIVLQLRDRTASPPHGIERIVAPLNHLLMPVGDIWIHVAIFDRSYHELLSAFEAFSPTGVLFEIPDSNGGSA